MSDNPSADKLRELTPVIMERWDSRVRAEVPAAASQEESSLHDSLASMLEVIVKVLNDETDFETAVRGFSYHSVHGRERAQQPNYSLGAMIRECQTLQAVVLEELEPTQLLNERDRTVIIQYFSELVRVAAEEYTRVQQQALQDYADRLEKMDCSKDEFLAMLGHELRNPLGAVSNALVLLRDGENRGELPAHALDVAERQVGHMKRMIDDLLDVARIATGKVILRTEPLDLGIVVQQAMEVVEELIEQRNHSFSMSHPHMRIYVNADPVRLGQCLTNLLINAAKYTSPGGRIDVTVEREDKQALMRVRDNGIGIAPDVLPEIFNLFQQAHQGQDRSEGGLGIGLSVVQRLIHLHGGTIEARSEGLGKGSEFIVRIPISEAIPEKPLAPLHKKSNIGVHVLLVEDNKDSSDMMSNVLKMLGHHVTVVKDGLAALEAVTEHCPDVALLDIGLPGMTGYELASKLKTSGVCPDSMKLIAFTGYAEDVEALAAAGFDSHMTKPIDLDRLEGILDSIVPIKA